MTQMPPYRPVQDALRAVGYYLDKHRYRLMSLVVIDNGLVVIVYPEDIHGHHEAVLLTHDDLAALWLEVYSGQWVANDRAPADPLFLTGYQDFMRALGDAAARQQWQAVRLLRLGDTVVIHHGPVQARQEMVLHEPDVVAILNRAFQQRGRGPLS